MDDESKCREFYKGLDEDIKNNMAIISPAETYDELVKQAITIDQRLYQCRLDKKIESSQNKPWFSNTQGSNPHNYNSNSNKPNTVSSNVVTNSNSTSSNSIVSNRPYKSRTRGHLTEEEKARHRQLNLYTYCASPKHHYTNCPLIVTKESKESPAKVGTISLPPPSYLASKISTSENSTAQAPMRTEA